MVTPPLTVDLARDCTRGSGAFPLAMPHARSNGIYHLTSGPDVPIRDSESAMADVHGAHGGMCGYLRQRKTSAVGIRAASGDNGLRRPARPIHILDAGARRIAIR
jgi:hypothetical protein